MKKIISKLLRVPRVRPSPAADAGAFLRRHGELLPADFSPARKPAFPMPSPLFGPLSEENDYGRQVGTCDRELARLKGVTVWSNEGFLVAGDEVLQETCWGPGNLKGHPVSTCRLQPRARRLKGEWFSCSLYWSTYYYHWMCDVLPRFYGVLEKLPDDVRFIIHAPLKEYEVASLAAFGITPDRCLPSDGFHPLKPETLFYATPSAMSGDHDPEALQWVRQKVRAHFLPDAVSAKAPNLRLYISRARTRMRRVVNEQELLPVLQRFGFTIVHAEELSFAEQVALFARAEMIMGPHGGGVTNMLWAPEGCVVFEIFEPQTVRRYFWSQAHSLGHRYFMSVAEAIPNPGTEADMRIDPEKLEEALRKILPD